MDINQYCAALESMMSDPAKADIADQLLYNDIQALESLMDEYELDLGLEAALEADAGESDAGSASGIGTKLRAGWDKIRHGIGHNDDAEIREGQSEVRSATKEAEDAEKATDDPEKKKKIKKALAIGAAGAAAVAIAAGLIAHGQKAKKLAEQGDNSGSASAVASVINTIAAEAPKAERKPTRSEKAAARKEGEVKGNPGVLNTGDNRATRRTMAYLTGEVRGPHAGGAAKQNTQRKPTNRQTGAAVAKAEGTSKPAKAPTASIELKDNRRVAITDTNGNTKEVSQRQATHQRAGVSLPAANAVRQALGQKTKADVNTSSDKLKKIEKENKTQIQSWFKKYGSDAAQTAKMMLSQGKSPSQVGAWLKTQYAPEAFNAYMDGEITLEQYEDFKGLLAALEDAQTLEEIDNLVGKGFDAEAQGEDMIDEAQAEDGSDCAEEGLLASLANGTYALESDNMDVPLSEVDKEETKEFDGEAQGEDLMDEANVGEVGEDSDPDIAAADEAFKALFGGTPAVENDNMDTPLEEVEGDEGRGFDPEAQGEDMPQEAQVGEGENPAEQADEAYLAYMASRYGM